MENKLHSNSFKKVLIWLIASIICFLLTIDVVYASGVNSARFQSAWADFMSEYRVILSAIAGLGALTSILVFIYHFIHLGAVGSNPAQRSQVIRNMLISAVCTALLGGISLFIVLFHLVMWGA